MFFGILEEGPTRALNPGEGEVILFFILEEGPTRALTPGEEEDGAIPLFPGSAQQTFPWQRLWRKNG